MTEPHETGNAQNVKTAGGDNATPGTHEGTQKVREPDYDALTSQEGTTAAGQTPVTEAKPAAEEEQGDLSDQSPQTDPAQQDPGQNDPGASDPANS